MDDDRDWPAIFDNAFRATSYTTQRSVWRAVMGEEYPEEVDPHSYVSWTELRLLGDQLRVGAGNVLVDVGCGRGGPGLWLAAHTGADLVGVDISSVALQAAGVRAAELGLGTRARFQLGSFADTGLGTACVDGIVSIDAFLFAPDKRAGAAELARVLRPGGRLALTTWDYHRQPAGRPPQVDDHRPLFDAAGFDIVSYVDTDDWRHRATAIGDGLLAAADEIAAETGDDAGAVRTQLAQMRRTVDDMTRRVLLIAQRR